MVRELKNIIEDIASIDTSIDIEDVKAIAQFNPEADAKICKLRDFLVTLDIKSVPVTEIAPTENTVTATHTKTYVELLTEIPGYKELLDIGFTARQIITWFDLYNIKIMPKKLSFVSCIKACKFVADELSGNNNKVAKTIITPKLKNYLSIIDPDVTYRPCNIHDFLRGATLKNISCQFFTCEHGYLIGVKQK